MSTRQVTLTSLWDCHGLLNTEFGPDACKEKQHVTQDTYFNTLMYLRNWDLNLELQVLVALCVITTSK